MIRERILERLARYREREPGTIYIHMLDVNLPEALERARDPPRLDNGYFVVGELLHAGLEAVLEPAPTRCVEVEVWEDEPVHPGGRVFVRRGTARLCGTADAVIEGYPVEFKTTARRNPPVNAWKRRARHYAMLYERPVILFIIDRIRGTTTETVVDPPRDPVTYRRWVVNEWLRNRYPYKPLDQYG